MSVIGMSEMLPMFSAKIEGHWNDLESMELNDLDEFQHALYLGRVLLLERIEARLGTKYLSIRTRI